MGPGGVRERDGGEDAGQVFGESAGFGVEERAGLGEAVEHEDFEGGGGWVGEGHCGVGRRKGRGI